MRLIKDSAGVPSWTMTLSVPAIVAITCWFAVGGIEGVQPALTEIARRHEASAAIAEALNREGVEVR